MKKEDKIEGLSEIRSAMKADWIEMFRLLELHPRAAAFIEAEKIHNSYEDEPELQLWSDVAMQSIIENEDSKDYENIMINMKIAESKIVDGWFKKKAVYILEDYEDLKTEFRERLKTQQVVKVEL
jgi:hypothetical protein